MTMKNDILGGNYIVPFHIESSATQIMRSQHAGSEDVEECCIIQLVW